MKLLIACVFLLSCVNVFPEVNLMLKKELLAMVERDQQLRKEVLSCTDLVQQQQWYKAIDELDVIHAKRMHEILNQFGWPGVSIVEEEGSRAAWLLVQHADHDLALQQRAQELMHSAVEKNDASAVDLAFLTDRILKNSGHPQRYGTQLIQQEDCYIPYVLEDSQQVNQLRHELGMQPLEEYIAFAQDCLRIHQNPH